MLDHTTHEAIATELIAAHASHELLPLLTARHPGMTVEDSYAVQRIWTEQAVRSGRRVVGHKIGLTSKVMQDAVGIDEPDYGVILDDMVHDSGVALRHTDFSNVRVEVELAFVLSREIAPGSDVADVLAATEAVVPALEVLNSHLLMEGRTIVDTISDNAAMGCMVVGDRHAPDGIDLPWVSAVVHRGDRIEDSGVAAAVLGHPARGVAWLADRLAAHGTQLAAGEIVLAGSFTRPMWVRPGDRIRADYGPLGVVECRFE